MKPIMTVACWANRAARAFLFMRCASIPYFGFALTAMLLLWVYKAIMR